LPKYKIVEEVVRESNMHYYMVPRLGSYLAVKLEFNSCLFEEAFDDAVANYAEVAGAKQELQVKKTNGKSNKMKPNLKRKKMVKNSRLKRRNGKR